MEQEGREGEMLPLRKPKQHLIKKGATTMRDTTTPPTLTLDVDLYQHYLDNSDLTEEQKQELLETLWNIICEFVRLGYGVHPLQKMLPENCGKTSENSKNDTISLPDMVECMDFSNTGEHL
jgi:hypothetical protein